MMVDYAELIKQTVTMEQILAAYGFSTRGRKRIACPIHRGEHANFSYTHNAYKCWSCQSSGSVIDFVMQYRNLPFVEAMQEINNLFGLGYPIGKGQHEPSEAEQEAQRKAEQLRLERERRQNRLKQLCTAYDAAMDYYAALDIIVQHDAPQGPYEFITPQYAFALKHIDSAWDRVQYAAEQIRNFEQKGE